MLLGLLETCYAVAKELDTYAAQQWRQGYTKDCDVTNSTSDITVCLLQLKLRLRP